MDAQRMIALAVTLLKEEPRLIEDAREGARVGNSVIGGALSIMTRAPRAVCEHAVLRAVARLDTGGKHA